MVRCPPAAHPRRGEPQLYPNLRLPLPKRCPLLSVSLSCHQPLGNSVRKVNIRLPNPDVFNKKPTLTYSRLEFLKCHVRHHVIIRGHYSSTKVYGGYDASGPVLGAKDVAVNKDKTPALMQLTFQWERKTGSQ